MAGVVDAVLTPDRRDLGGFFVRRALPSPKRRSVGPFVFWDEAGPGDFAPGQGLDVRPHPHIGLATVTYLFEGELLHRDSVGSVQAIRPGDVNWMTAGRGIVHSERTPRERRRHAHSLHGIQAWVGLPRGEEEVEPDFSHHPAATLPTIDGDRFTLRLIAGSAYGAASPVPVCSPMICLEARLQAGARLALPEEHPERAAYVVSGRVQAGEAEVAAGSMAVFGFPAQVELHCLEAGRVMVLGGAPLDGRRHLWWNLVSSDRERIARARDDWQRSIDSGFLGTRFGLPPGEEEHIPLPEPAGDRPG